MEEQEKNGWIEERPGLWMKVVDDEIVKQMPNRIKKSLCDRIVSHLPRSIRVRYSQKYFYAWLRTKDERFFYLYLDLSQ